jgi:hypothetical protein
MEMPLEEDINFIWLPRMKESLLQVSIENEGHRTITTQVVVFSSFKIPKILQDSLSHRIFRRMYGALNIGKKITNYTVWL